MKTFAIKPLRAPLPRLTGREFGPEGEAFCLREYAAIDAYVWPGDYRPEARAYAAWDAAGLSILMCAREATICAQVRPFGGDVYLDSCLECFLRPFADDGRYVNIEMNAAGSALMGLGTCREDRVRLARAPEGVAFDVSRHGGSWWAVSCHLPFAAIEALYGRSAGDIREMRGNFYCCDESIHPHFGSWSPIDAPAPDFHRPECFGTILLTR